MTAREQTVSWDENLGTGCQKAKRSGSGVLEGLAAWSVLATSTWKSVEQGGGCKKPGLKKMGREEGCTDKSRQSLRSSGTWCLEVWLKETWKQERIPKDEKCWSMFTL